MCLSHTVFEINGATTGVFNVPIKGFPTSHWNFVMVVALKLDRHTDGRTDWQNWYNNIALCMNGMLTCDKIKTAEMLTTY